jgi:predicted nucleic acid-binding protein
MKFLVDANVLSEGTKPQPVEAVVEWLTKHNEDLAVNPIILGELEYGILLLPPGRRRRGLERWFAEGVRTLHSFELDRDTASVWAVLLADLERVGHTMPIQDSLIAATARQHRLTVATRNVEDFRHAGVAIVNPFEA